MTDAVRNHAMEIASALARADAQTLAALAFELLASLGEVRATLASFEARQARDREYDRHRKRRVRRTPTESSGIPGLSPFSPTPPFNPSTSTASSSPRVWQPGREAELAGRLVTDADRIALAALLAVVGNKTAWVLEIHAMLDGMPGHRKATPDAMGLALRQYVLNNKHHTANAAEFDAYVRRAMNPKSESGPVRRGGVGERTYQNAKEALGDD